MGKSTLFTALTAAKAPIANYPFTTIDPHVGVVEVPDPRLDRIAAICRSRAIVPTTVEFVDIAGLVKGASEGQGLGNRFLGHIREVDAIIHVLRCFQDPDVVHVDGTVDPIRDLEVIRTELVLADLEAVQRRLERLEKKAKAGEKEARNELSVARRMQSHLNEGGDARHADLSPEEFDLLREYHLLTQKPALFVANVSEDDPQGKSGGVEALRERARQEQSEVVILSGKIEAELQEIPADERMEFLKQVGLTEPGLPRLIRAAYRLLRLLTFFTAGESEARAWTVLDGTKAPAAAGKIHSDMEKGFIRAEVMSYADLERLGGAAAVKEKGLLRLEGKEYTVRDGDVIYFRFNV